MDKMKIIAGNCVLEDMNTSLKTASFLKEHAQEFNYKLIYKSSWRKDNRSSVDYYEGPSIQSCGEIFEGLKSILGNTAIISDFHVPEEFSYEFVELIDILQLPAYLCMQTTLIKAMAQVGKPINIKKGQFLHPLDTRKIRDKIWAFQSDQKQVDTMITERGTCFGYRDLVFDPRSIQILASVFDTVYFDAGHCVRKYGIPSSCKAGGFKQDILPLANAAIASGADGIFVEVHPDPQNAKCDAATQLDFGEYDTLIHALLPIWEAIHRRISV